MCGICGVYNFDPSNVVAINTIQGMMNIMKHRGPDDKGVFIDKNVGLGFVRLSIIDLSPAGHQPMISEDGRYVMIFNGEIFNYIELRSELLSHGESFKTGTDTEVLLKAYIRWGKSCLDRLNGMWAFIIFDTHTKKLFGARDRFGVKPFYYYLSDACFVFCSEIHPLLTLQAIPREPDKQAVFDYLVFNRTDQGDNTFYQGIHKIPHASCFTLENGILKIAKWYDLRSRISKPFIDSDEYLELFSDAIRLRLRSDVPVGVCLSGGLDSSSIVSTLVSKFSNNNVHTFSAVYGKGKIGDESEYIDLYRKTLSNMHFTTPSSRSLLEDYPDFIKTIGEPTPSTAPYAQYKVMQLAQEHVVVTLDGQGADEQLAGYHYFFGFYFKELLRRAKISTLTKEISNYMLNHGSIFGLKSFIYFLLPSRLKTSLRTGENSYLNTEFMQSYSQTNQISDNLYGAIDLQDSLIRHFEYKLEHLLKWEDRNSMRFSIEARVPFLDYRLVERTLATQSSLIIRNGVTKHILRQAMIGILPEDIRLRQDKVGFDTPQDEWFRESNWKALIDSTIKNQVLSEYLNLNRCNKLYLRHLNSSINISKEIWKWFCLEYWLSELEG